MIFWTRSGEPLGKTKRNLEQNRMNPWTRSSKPPEKTRCKSLNRAWQIPGWSQEGYLRQNQASPWTGSSELQRSTLRLDFMNAACIHAGRVQAGLQRSAHYRETMQQISRARRDEFTVRNAFPVSAISQLR